MADRTTAKQGDGLSFEIELHGHRFMVDADESVGGEDRGPRPKGLLLSSLAGCTGMDVASILKKMRMPYDSFELDISGELTDEHPKVYHSIHIRYIFTGSDLDESKIEKAVSLSVERYCGVNAMLSKTATITTEIVLN
jgi:putative redox protein